MNAAVMKRLPMLWRRELWEHRGLWLAPVIAAGLLVLVLAAGALQLMQVNLGPLRLGADVQVTTPDATVTIDKTGKTQVTTPDGTVSVQADVDVQLDDSEAQESGVTIDMPGLSIRGGDTDVDIEELRKLRNKVPLNMVLSAVLLMLLMVSLFPVTGFLMESLYADRRDRSVLFWRSLPVSDTATVLGKLSLAPVVLLGTWALAAVVSVPVIGLVKLGGAAPLLDASWTVGRWLSGQALLLGLLLVNLLWYAPVFALLLVVSAWARRSPYGWALGVPLLAMMAESMLLGTKHLARLVGHRLAPIELQPGVLDPWLWVGLVAAAALVALAIRLRRNAEAS